MNPIIEVLQEVARIAHWTILPESTASGEALSLPPFIAWRYEQPAEELASFLREAISTFQGTLNWELRAMGRRWILTPARIREYAELHGCNEDLFVAEELKRAEPDFGKRANAELRLLAKHIRCCLTVQRGFSPGKKRGRDS